MCLRLCRTCIHCPRGRNRPPSRPRHGLIPSERSKGEIILLVWSVNIILAVAALHIKNISFLSFLRMSVIPEISWRKTWSHPSSIIVWPGCSKRSRIFSQRKISRRHPGLALCASWRTYRGTAVGPRSCPSCGSIRALRATGLRSTLTSWWRCWPSPMWEGVEQSICLRSLVSSSSQCQRGVLPWRRCT